MSPRKIARAALALTLSAGGILAASSPASAATDNNLVGPIRENCKIAGQSTEVSFDVWIRWSPQSTKYAIDKFNWDTHSFTPSRLVVSVRDEDSSGEDIVRIWGGKSSSLNDVPAKFGTIQPWEAPGKHSAVNRNIIYSTVYLNAAKSCHISIRTSEYW